MKELADATRKHMMSAILTSAHTTMMRMIAVRRRPCTMTTGLPGTQTTLHTSSGDENMRTRRSDPTSSTGDTMQMNDDIMQTSVDSIQMSAGIHRRESIITMTLGEAIMTRGTATTTTVDAIMIRGAATTTGEANMM